jgi:hypothetical protein
MKKIYYNMKQCFILLCLHYCFYYVNKIKDRTYYELKYFSFYHRIKILSRNISQDFHQRHTRNTTGDFLATGDVIKIIIRKIIAIRVRLHTISIVIVYILL